MEDQIRFSPVFFDRRPELSEIRNGWQVIQQYEDEGQGPSLVDLSHLSKWDLQDAELSRIRPFGIEVPETPGRSVLRNGVLANRLSPTQASVWELTDQAGDSPQESCFTDITDGLALLALVGPGIFSFAEKVTSLDLQRSDTSLPFVIQGPVLHVPSQVVVLTRDVLLIAFSRGYGQTMVDAFLQAGTHLGLTPAGETVFSQSL